MPNIIADYDYFDNLPEDVKLKFPKNFEVQGSIIAPFSVIFDKILNALIITGGVNHRGRILPIADVSTLSFARTATQEREDRKYAYRDALAFSQFRRGELLYPSLANVKLRKADTPHKLKTRIEEIPIYQELLKPETAEQATQVFMYNSSNAYIDTFNNRYLYIPILMTHNLILGYDEEAESQYEDVTYIPQTMLNEFYQILADVFGGVHPLLSLLMAANQVYIDLQMLRTSNSYFYNAVELLPVVPEWTDIPGFLVAKINEATSTNAITYTGEVFRKYAFYGFEPNDFLEINTYTWDSDRYEQRHPIELGTIAHLIRELQPEIHTSRASTIGVAGETGSGKTTIFFNIVEWLLTGKTPRNLLNTRKSRLCETCTDQQLVKEVDQTDQKLKKHLFAFGIADEPMNPVTRMEPIMERSRYKIPQPRFFKLPVFGADFIDLFIQKILPHVNSATFFLDSITSLLYTEDSHTIATTGTGLQAEGLRWYSRPLFLAINDLFISSEIPIEFIMTMNVPLDARNVAYLIAGVSDFFIMLDRNRPGDIIIANSFSRHRHLIEEIQEGREGTDQYIITNNDYYRDNLNIPIDGFIH